MTENSDREERPESDYSRQTIRRRQLRTGYTTGSCAAAAAKAATQALLTGTSVSESTIRLPVGRDVTFQVNHCQWSEEGDRVTCAVTKDGGDDPDVTHGAEICCTVWRDPDLSASGVRIVGGAGVGTVTRPGTGIEVGEPAVTRVPRRMIVESVGQAASEYGLDSNTGLVVQVSVPGGEEIAKETTNSRRSGVHLHGIFMIGARTGVSPKSSPPPQHVGPETTWQ
ncbi:Cobalt-precorrin-5B C(1)-methyltransferase [Geodia barretti]|uniref:Cobalt-precorrin-5B C(1)-methyltransferase n=1 Tax=Geodia barretti TaxID=519541 RepID=A0AA35SZP9_GEOBA|nr:Cobalt-precorrin-5B C(1)-methyltransferase [Geodia barretti]